MKHFVLLLLLAVLFFGNTQAQTTYYVSASAGSNSNDGTSASTPFASIQAAISAAVAGDEIWVTAETYLISSILSVSLDINMKGGYNPSFTEQTGYTTLDGNNARRVIEFHGISGIITFDHFIIQNGKQYNGGGMHIYASNLSLTNIIFYNNTANGENGKGGAIFMEGSNAKLTNVAFIGNSSNNWGGALHLDESFPILTNVTFFNNYAANNGGAIYLISASKPVVRNTVFWSNTAGAGNDDIDSYNWENCYVDPASSNNASSFSNIADNNTAGSTRYGDNTTYIKLTSNPFTNSNDPDGDDNIFGTSDDGLVPGSQLTGEGRDGYNTLTYDLTGGCRKIKTIDIGAYEGKVIYYVVNYLQTGNHDGSNWDNAFDTLSYALIDYGTRGCIFRVAANTTNNPYYIGKTINITKDIEIYGGYDIATNTQTGYTVLDGYGIFQALCTSGLTSRAVFDHLIIQNFTSDYGGGMHNDNNSSPTLINVTFSGNSASSNGAGMYNSNGSSPTLINVTFSGNIASYSGGGMYNYNYSSPTLINVTFSGNIASIKGGGMYNDIHSSPTLTNVIFSKNRVPIYGGGMYNYYYSSPTLTNVVFSENSGSGLYNTVNSSPTVINATFIKNTADWGGAIRNENSSPKLYNSVFYANSASHSTTGDISDYNSTTAYNSKTAGIYNASNRSSGGLQKTECFIVLTSDPFTNSSTPEGADGEWGTSDDGLIPADGSYLINTGDKIYNSSTTDITGEQRVQNERIDLGAYETAFFAAISIFTGSGSWGTNARWSGGVPDGSGPAIINGECNLTSANRTVDELTINPSASLNIYPGAAMTVNNTLTNNADPGGLVLQSDAGGSASLIANGTVTGKAMIERHMSGDGATWHLTGVPVGGQNIQELIDNANNSFSTNGTQYGLGVYNEATDNWITYTTSTYGSAGNLTAGQGYETNIQSTGTIEFAGTLSTSQVNVPITHSGRGWNLLGNPYPCALYANSAADASNNFLTLNAIVIDDSYKALYFWNPTTSSYDIVNNASAATYIASGQAFFVKSKAWGGIARFTTAMRTHQTGAAFKSGTANPNIILKAANGERAKTTEFRFVEGTTLGLDPGYDAGLFNGKTDEFKLCSRLMQDNDIDFALQCFSTDDFENAVIPIELNSPSSTVEFSVETSNLPSNIKVYLEDKQDNSFNLLDGTQTYTAQVNIGENTGRFYIHTSEQALDQMTELTEGEYGIVPNFQSSSLTIKGVLSGEFFVKVYDISGKLVFEKQSVSNEIFLPDMATGIYVVNLIGEGVSYSQKVNWIK